MSESVLPSSSCPNCESRQTRVAELEMLVAQLQAMIAELQATIAEQQATIAEQQAANTELQATVVGQQATITEQQARLGKNSTNSSQPPSSDPPQVKRPPKKKPSGKPRGAQHGHPGSHRELLPPEEVDEIIPLYPEVCLCCQEPLSGAEDQPPQRHQIVELPEVRPLVIEYQLHSAQCSCCGQRTWAQLPEGVGPGAFGPRLQAFVALLVAAYRISRRKVKELLHDAFQIELSVGSVQELEQQTSAAVATPVEEAKAAVKEQPVINVDETGWKEGGNRAWLWVAVTAMATVFLVRARRAKEVAMELIGEGFRGTLVSDRYSAYAWVGNLYRQLCWAHLIRDFRALSEREGPGKEIAEGLLACGKRLFEWWYRVRDGTLRRSTFQTYASGVRKEVRQWLERGVTCGHKETAKLCAALLERECALWAFVRTPGVEPTNNSAERALRTAVIWRRLSFGTRSAAGSRFVERMLTVVATLRQHDRPVLEYLTEACQAARDGRPAPSLLVTPDHDRLQAEAHVA